jgi:hypothetical protein
MASLGTRKSGKLAFDKYVSDNPLWKPSHPFYIEKSGNLYELKSGEFVVKGQVRKGQVVNIINATLFISDRTVKGVQPGTRFVQIKVKSSSLIGYVQLASVAKPTNKGPGGTTIHERIAIARIDNLVKSFGRPITIKCGSFKFDDCAGAINIQGTPKADFAIVNSRGTPVVFISHKDGNQPSDFRQYGGITDKAGPVIKNDPETISFVEDMAARIDDKVDMTTSYYREIKNSVLWQRSIFGPNFTSVVYGIDNVHVVGQGDPILSSASPFAAVGSNDPDDTYVLTFSGHSLFPDETTLSGGYQPVLAAIPSAGRSFNYKGKRYTGFRLGIYPLAYVKKYGKWEEMVNKKG